MSFLLFKSQILGPVFCYWGTWSYYRGEPGLYGTQHVDGSLCTHLVYSFFGVTPTGQIRHFDPELDLDRGVIAATLALRSRWPHLKVLAAIGGWSEESSSFSSTAMYHREAFATNILIFLRQHGFDGVDIDWEYPGLRGGVPEDKNNFVLMMEAIYNR